MLSSRDRSRLTRCKSEDQVIQALLQHLLGVQASPLHMLPQAPFSSVYGMAPPDVLMELQHKKVSINFHEWCLTPTNFTRWPGGLGYIKGHRIYGSNY